MSNVDPLRIRDLLGNIGASQQRLRELGQLSEVEFLADFRNTESAKYLLIVATEAAIDICNHIVSRQKGRPPNDYATCFTVLQDLQIIDQALAQRLGQMARFRNLLVHLYWQVDNHRIYQIIQDNLSDFDLFHDQIAAWLIS